MTEPLISRQTLNAWRDYFTSSTLRKITEGFEAAGIERNANVRTADSSERRRLVDQYYGSLNLNDAKDVSKLLTVYANELFQMELVLYDPSGWGSGHDDEMQAMKSNFNRLTRHLERDGYTYDEGALGRKDQDEDFAELMQHAMQGELDYLRLVLLRLKKAAETDPPHAIGTAKELVETCCKTILKAHANDAGDKLDLGPLLKATMSVLKLTPDDVPDAAKGAEIIKRLLPKLGSIVHDLAELRNKYGTGHGREGNAKTLQPRHAKLAVGMAATLTTFLFETHQQRQTTARCHRR